MSDYPGPERRRASSKLDELYDALIGTPSKRGELELIRETLKAIDRRQDQMEARQDDHETAHATDEEKREAVATDLRRAIIPVVIQGVLAAFAAITATVISVQQITAAAAEAAK